MVWILEDDKSKKESEDLKKEYEEKIKDLEKRLNELETKETKEDEPSVVGDLVGQFFPSIGGLIKTLEKTSPEFRKRIEDTDSEIKHRIDMGWSSKPVVEYNISTRPLGTGPKRRGGIGGKAKPRTISVTMPEKVPTKEPTIDVFEEDNHITVIAELPGMEKNEIETTLSDNYLEISAGGRSKKVELPSKPKSILEKTYKHGILQLKMDKENDGGQS